MRKIIVGVTSVFFVAVSIMGLPAMTSAAGHGSAGCGLGSIVFGADNTWWKQVLAATTNGTSANQTFGITSGTSNCSASSSLLGMKLFIETNRQTVAKDVSKGAGETITGIATLGGCADPAAVGQSLQKNFSEIFPNSEITDEAVSSGIINTLMTDDTLQCKSLQG